jgi:hypothetical protein
MEFASTRCFISANIGRWLASYLAFDDFAELPSDLEDVIAATRSMARSSTAGISDAGLFLGESSFSFRAFHISFCATTGLKLLDFLTPAARICTAQTIIPQSKYGCFSIFVGIEGWHAGTHSIKIAQFIENHAIIPVKLVKSYSNIGIISNNIALFVYIAISILNVKRYTWL